jgi:hypothetical protein
VAKLKGGKAPFYVEIESGYLRFIAGRLDIEFVRAGHINTTPPGLRGVMHPFTNVHPSK